MNKILKFSLRIDKTILNNIRILAEQDGRSLNAINRGMFGEDSLKNKHFNPVLILKYYTIVPSV